MYAFDRRTDRQTDGQTAFSSPDRVCISCSAVIRTKDAIFLNMQPTWVQLGILWTATNSETKQRYGIHAAVRDIHHRPTKIFNDVYTIPQLFWAAFLSWQFCFNHDSWFLLHSRQVSWNCLNLKQAENIINLTHCHNLSKNVDQSDLKLRANKCETKTLLTPTSITKAHVFGCFLQSQEG